ncbi:hypothetical protein HYV81_01490 [Candidatus Woesearchaeota archaeon]|nr:hypothetical protein [Candidatus Woesearchaeota archaeon]
MRCKTCNKPIRRSANPFTVLRRVFFDENKFCSEACARQFSAGNESKQDLEQKLVADAVHIAHETETPQAIEKIDELKQQYVQKPRQVHYHYSISIPIKQKVWELKGPAEEQVAFDKAAGERLNPLQPLKPIKAYWETDVIKKILNNIAEFFSLRDIYSDQYLSYSFSYQKEQDAYATLL